MIEVNAGQGKSTLEISIVVGRVIGEVKPPGCVLVAKTIRTGCPGKDVGVKIHASLCRSSNICRVGDIELG